MTATAPHPRAPLVLGAPPRAINQARDLHVEGCLENRVRDAILAGRVTGAREGEIAYAYLEPNARVAVERVRTSSGRLAWKPLRVDRWKQRR